MHFSDGWEVTGSNPVRAAGIPAFSCFPETEGIEGNLHNHSGLPGGHRFWPHIVCNVVPPPNPTSPPKAAYMLLLQEAFLEWSSPSVTLCASLQWILGYSAQFHSLGRKHSSPSCSQQQPSLAIVFGHREQTCSRSHASSEPAASDGLRLGDQVQPISLDLGRFWLQSSCRIVWGLCYTCMVGPLLPHPYFLRSSSQ